MLLASEDIKQKQNERKKDFGCAENCLRLSK